MTIRGRCESVATELGLQAALQGLRLVLVLAPHASGRAGIADGSSLVHRAKREWVLGPAKEAVDLHAGRVAGEDADVPDRAAADAT